MTVTQAQVEYLLRLGDSAHVLGQRLAEWSGHGPVLEQDIALSNIALDLFGQTQNLLDHAAQLDGKDQDADFLAYHRDAHAYRNHLLAELPKGDWGRTILRQFFFDAYQVLNYDWLRKHSKDAHLAAIAEKSFKEVQYHLRFSSEWTIRLGDGTEESNLIMQSALEYLWPYTGELFEPNAVDTLLTAEGIAPDLAELRVLWLEKVREILEEATLPMPAEGQWRQTGGKNGIHTENLGYILAEMQFMQRAYPGQKW